MELCVECGRRQYKKYYAVEQVLCGTCGSTKHLLSSANASDLGCRIQVDTPIMDENIDGVERVFTSKRAHIHALDAAGLVNKHYQNKGYLT